MDSQPASHTRQRSADLFARAQQLIPGGVNSPVRAFRSVGGAPFFTQRAEGAHLHTSDGDDLIDFVCTWGPAIHGHNDPDVRAAIAQALENGTSFGTPNPYEVEMAYLKLKQGMPCLYPTGLSSLAVFKTETRHALSLPMTNAFYGMTLNSITVMVE